MILRIEMQQVRNKILAIKFLRTVGKIGLKEAKELVETLQNLSPAEAAVYRYPAEDISLSGTIWIKVDPVFALTNLLAALNGTANRDYVPAETYVPVPIGMMVYAEPDPKVVDIS